MVKKPLNKVSEMLNVSLKEVNGSIDANIIIGEARKITDSVTIIPISKITFGYLSGGGEYGDVKMFTKEKSHPFAGGTSGIVNMSPAGFLILEENSYRYVKAEEDIFDKIINKTSDIIGAFNKNEKN